MAAGSISPGPGRQGAATGSVALGRTDDAGAAVEVVEVVEVVDVDGAAVVDGVCGPELREVPVDDGAVVPFEHPVAHTSTDDAPHNSDRRPTGPAAGRAGGVAICGSSDEAASGRDQYPPEEAQQRVATAQVRR
ncbi:hypothetical protein G3I60_01095 [Streptomyces sp. SID13666]|uniref:hypothetical protein n=1 Tax=unclassified Streptomyces TaxID=2593676 RepID=UPI0013C10DB7|nr:MULTISPECIES: hypothetical protein [unclassified Streptomyces]NEA52804.1 hypothetical protein [Streptomyces sp. SID13666]NEA69869.1 hypothetical protein [Streptomyces sp. SID13588]